MNRRFFLKSIAAAGVVVALPVKAVAAVVDLVRRRNVIIWTPNVPWWRRLMWWKRPENTHYDFRKALDAAHKLHHSESRIQIDSGPGETGYIPPGIYDMTDVVLTDDPGDEQ